MKIIEQYLRERIKQLNEADAEFCKERWDKSKPEIVRSLYREQSNNVTFARQELEAILEFLELPRFKETPKKDGPSLGEIMFTDPY